MTSAWKAVRGGGWSSVAAVLALSLGVASFATASAVAYSGLLRPLPFPHPAELWKMIGRFQPGDNQSSPRLKDLDTWARGLSGVAVVAGSAEESVTVRRGGGAEEVRAAYVAGPWFDMLGVHADAGRTFSDADGVDVTVVSRRFATRVAGSPAAAVGQVLALATRSLRVVGVAPASMDVLSREVDLWLPARGADALTLFSADDTREYSLVARLAPGHGVPELQSRADAVLRGIVPERQRNNWRESIRPLRDVLLGDARPILIVFALASMLVFLIACLNVATLLMSRAVARGREFAVRLALGASRGRLIRDALTEVALVAFGGLALGWWIASLATAALATTTRAGAYGLPSVTTTAMTGPVAAAAAIAFLATIAICGYAPMLAAGRAQVSTSLRVAASTSSRASRRARGALVVAQLAMAVVLLVGAGLLGRTLLVVGREDLGVDAPEQVTALAVPLGESLLASSGPARLDLVDRIVDDARRLPGVTFAGVGNGLPPAAASLAFSVRFVSDSRDQTRSFDFVSVTDGYLEALGARIVAGRLFTPIDTHGSEPVVVLSESAMRHLGLDAGAVDHRLNMALPSTTGKREPPRVVGIVHDVRYAGLDAAAKGGIYVLWRQAPTLRSFLVVRTAGDPAATSRALPGIVRAADHTLPLGEARSLVDEVDRTLAPRSARFGLVGVYATAAVLLAIVGLTAALARSVVERQRELAIRAAIGATPRALLSAVIGSGLMLTVAGLAFGAALSAAAARAGASVIFGISPYDPLTYVVAVAFVLVVSLTSSYIPARRAASTDPLILLRSE